MSGALPAAVTTLDPCAIPGASTLCNAVGSAVGSVAQSAAQTFVDGFADGFATLVKTMLTFWVRVPTPAINAAGGPVAHLQQLVLWVQGVVLVASLLFVAAQMMLTRSSRAAGQGAKALGLMVVFTGAGAAGIDILTAAGDSWSTWIINQSANGDLAQRLAVVTGGAAVLSPLGIGVEFVVALLGILSCIAQIFLLLARVGVLTLLVGTLPLSAAGLATPAGRAWFTRVLGWVVAFVLYKPAAAMVYAAAFTLTGTGKDLTSVLSGLLLIVLAVLALPALMRLVAPMVAAASGGGGGQLAGALAGAALATGARQVTSSSASGGGGSGGHSPGLASTGGAGAAGAPGRAGAPGAAAPTGAASTGATAGAAGAAGAGGAGAAGAGAAGGGGAAAAGAVGGPVGMAVATGVVAVAKGAKTAAEAATGPGGQAPEETRGKA